ncbi:MOSC N-terminal beta barrel [Penicillium verhagenii]|uniref:MOSC N-terminal beta barrel n=1 Tax=Penicillium verhagenii TaxID=1562060 RepID=UPI0025458868|nr:MOSC N-terminal beta barrel [Penicillium verhagenii]KAJ5927759.1 MOSC N-terminal beta barrel [Penicillium verhagenii]
MSALQAHWGDMTSWLTLLICCLPIIVFCSRPKPQIRPKGCRRLGLPPGKSNLHDEFDSKYNSGVPPTEKDGDLPAWRIKALFTYPLKSCGGIELQTSDIVPTGLKFDRQFVFAEHGAEGWNTRTLRNAGFQRLALIHAEIWVPDPSARDYDPSLPGIQSQGIMIISYPRPQLPGRARRALEKVGMTIGILRSRHSFQVPLLPSQDSISEYPLLPVKIWKDKPLAHDYSALIPSSLHAYLGFNPAASPLGLFRASPVHTRQIFRNAPRKEAIGFQPNTAFADAYPIHLLSLSSHRDVAARCAYAIPKLSIVRFRANIVIQGPSAFAEDHWKRISIGGVEIHAACRTVRCKLPNVDPLTGVRHAAEPDRALKSYRKIDDGDRTNACLGMQLVPAVEEFLMKVGDEVAVLETGEHRYIKMLAPGEQVEGV